MNIELIDSIAGAKHALEKSHSVAQIMIEQAEDPRGAARSRLLAEVMLDYIAEAEECLSEIE